MDFKTIKTIKITINTNGFKSNFLFMNQKIYLCSNYFQNEDS